MKLSLAQSCKFKATGNFFHGNFICILNLGRKVPVIAGFQPCGKRTMPVGKTIKTFLSNLHKTKVLINSLLREMPLFLFISMAIVMSAEKQQ